VTRRIDQVDQEIRAVGLLADDVLEVLWIREVAVQGDSSGFDSNTTLLLIRTGIGSSGVTGLCCGDDTGLGQEGVGKGGLSVIDVSNNGHVTDVRRLVHQRADLLDGEAVAKTWLANESLRRHNDLHRVAHREASHDLERALTARILTGVWRCTHLTMVAVELQEAD